MADGTIGETPERAWLIELLNRGFPEGDGHVMADAQMIMAMCRAEPKSAQVGMQMLAQQLRARRARPPKQRDADQEQFLAYALGVLYTCYGALALAEGRIREDEVPPGLEVILGWNPEILECANALGPLQVME